MKKTLTTFLAMICTGILFAQVPQAMNYQAIYRNSLGQVMPNSTIQVEYIIHEISAVGNAVYIEDEQSTTNQFGLFTHAIGTGIPVAGSFNAVSWSSSDKFLEVKINGSSLGTSQLLSVPYALFAASTPHTAPHDSVFLSGTGAYTPPSGVLYIKVKMVGGGGGGSGSSNSACPSGSAGLATTFGPLSASGGAASSGFTNGGTGGVASLGGATGIALSGGDGCSPGRTTSNPNTDSPGGSGGSSVFGGSGRGGVVGSGGSAGKVNSGGGGGGGGSNAGNNINSGTGGGAGGYVEALIPNPTGPYSWTVGTGGTGGSAGPAGFSGGAGGSGVIIVEEYYQ
jgi:hypothetical protein